MRKVTSDELLSLSAYEAVRDRFRARMIEHKKRRRLLVGPEMSVVFEDHDTVLLQVQEMLRAERISDPAAVAAEVATYNDLVPPDGCLLATVMIEVTEEATRERRRRELLGLDACIALDLGGRVVPGVFAPEGLYPDRIAVVQFVRFELGEAGRAALRELAQPARFRVTHRLYQHDVALDEATRRSLAADVDPANAEVRP